MKYHAGDRIKFETSKGTVYGLLRTAYGLGTGGRYVIEDSLDVELSKVGEEILTGLYSHCGVSLDQRTGWVSVHLEDGCYGSPEYKATKIAPFTQETR